MENEATTATRTMTSSNHDEVDPTQGSEDMSLDDEYGSDLNEEHIADSGFVGCNFDDDTAINGLQDIWKVEVKEAPAEYLKKFHFPNNEVAFVFYNWYANVNGFAARKSKYMRNIKGEITQQTFLCYREGTRQVKVDVGVIRKRRSKLRTRCGCLAKCRVHIEATNGRWYIKYLNDEHNHSLLDDKFMGMLLAHRKMTNYDILQMNNMRKVGIRTPHIYGLFANQAGGYQKVGFRKRDMYNQLERQRRSNISDASNALGFLESMRFTDDKIFWKHTVDEDGRLEKLIWFDGVGRMDYSVFGDVLAFDATYRKNKYLCPLVVFSGVNHHNQSIVFGSAIVGDETEKTYVWLLEQFLIAMGGKSPTSVITDGDLAMKNAIKRVFPDAHHRLCAWHLLRNATSNVGNVQFVSRLRQCMLGDYDIAEFKRKWESMVAEFGVEENKWVNELHKKRNMWATAHIRGKFFAGFRTTSRCEALHSQLGKYVNFQNNLLEFLHHYFRCLSFMRYKEVEADFNSVNGDIVMQSEFHSLERSAANVYTKEVFLVFLPVLKRACRLRVSGFRQTTSSYIYTVSKYCREGSEWFVSYYPASLEFKCSCLRLESLGIPCEHLICVITYLDIVKLLDCLVLKRWKKDVKDSLPISNDCLSSAWDPSIISQYVGIVEHCKRMACAAVKCQNAEYIRSIIEWISAHTETLESIAAEDVPTHSDFSGAFEEHLMNPAPARTKGRRSVVSSSSIRSKKPSRKAPTCGVCREEGHNRKCCPVQRQIDAMSQNQVGSNFVYYANEE